MPDPAGVKEVARRWRLSNKETERAVWLVENQRAIINPQTMKWSALQPILIDEGIHDLLELMEASSPEGDKAAAYCLNLLSATARNPRSPAANYRGRFDSIRHPARARV